MNALAAWTSPNLRTRISLVLTALSAVLLAVLGGVWVQETRVGIHEEVEAATRVSEQWLTALARESAGLAPDAARARLLALVQPVGRIRANALEVVDPRGQRVYVSPPPTYKQGRSVPDWFEVLVDPGFVPRRIVFGDLTAVLYPDPSRAILDAWDDLRAMAGWACALLVLLFLVVRFALDRALKPLGQVMAALDQTGRGRFDTRLPIYEVPDLARLAKAFNGMADRLAQAVDENVRLESDRQVACRMQSRLEEERRTIARELHDELSQGITAVRALAGAIVQRTDDQAALQSPARSIVEVTGEIQDGVRNILARLRPSTGDGQIALVLGRYLDIWQERHPGIVVESTFLIDDRKLSDEQEMTALRVVQESLTNVVRHAGATRVVVSVAVDDGWLEICVTDNGRGLGPGPSAQPGSGLGLAGMRERLEALGGRLAMEDSASGGCRLAASLPLAENRTSVGDDE